MILHGWSIVLSKFVHLNPKVFCSLKWNIGQRFRIIFGGLKDNMEEKDKSQWLEPPLNLIFTRSSNLGLTDSLWYEIHLGTLCTIFIDKTASRWKGLIQCLCP